MVKLSFTIALAVLIILFCGVFYAYRRVFFVDKKRISNPLNLPSGKYYDGKRELMVDLISEAMSIPYKEDVYTQSFDGYKLRARYYETEPGAPLQILFHGYRGNALRDFSGGLKLSLSTGCNVLLIDERAHDMSEGKCLSFGVLERKDVLSWVDFAIDKFGPETEIILVGISMGAATVLMASELPLPENVKGIVADCPYSSPAAIIKKVMKDGKMPVFPVYGLVKLSAKIPGGFDLEESSAIEAVKHAKLPLLLVHGQADSFVPHSMSVEISENYAGPCRFESFPDAEHGMCFVEDYDRYKNAVLEFVKELVKG